MMTFSGCKRLDIPDGRVKSITRKSDGQLLWKSGYTNQVPLSINADGSIYNGGLGYKNGYRVRSGGAEAAAEATCTGFIPVQGGDVIRISGRIRFSINSTNNAINVSDASFTNLGQLTPSYANSGYGILAASADWGAYGYPSVTEESAGVWKWVVPPAESAVAYIRVTGYNTSAELPGKELIVTVNEEIA